MRILLATDAWEPQVNGVVTTLRRTIEECEKLGHEFHIIDYNQFKTVSWPDYPEVKLALGCYEEVRGIILDYEPDAIHIATEGFVGMAARRVCQEFKLPFTTSYHTKFPEYVSARLPIPLSWGYAFMRWFHKPSGRVMVATPTLQKDLEARGFKNISPWTRGVDTVTFRPGLEPIFGDLPRPIMTYVGRVAVEKNIEAFLSLDLPGTKVVVGKGPQLEELKLKYPDVVFTGPRFGEELARSYADSDVFVFPSLTDTFGLVITEAMAAGTPVAAFPAHGPIDIIPGSGAGAINDDLSIAIREALKIDRGDVRAYAEKFSWPECAAEFIRNLEPYPEPAKTKLWTRLRQLPRKIRRKPEAA
ncbi:GDP-mannose-dependent alpha-mannosyltransferase [Asticcacaulis sp. AC466]|uniref:glycosyltransferase family 4 protein n=1 Tax=Asticcacaulis sp. AC466 TaxID=1282362 RepID=UPI0003C3C06B|nr:glycosyltransferase family 1 protein [Asticcacaulis sp. AC466]ESQ84667.1 GDP-mannose-dependent alpha-mannosyltransferase [Asticcacaulis sp. AC466]